MSELREEIVQEYENSAASENFERMVLQALNDVALPIEIRIGSAELTIRELLNCGPGTVVALDSPVGANVDMLVNGKQVASGELIAIDGRMGVRITDVLGQCD